MTGSDDCGWTYGDERIVVSPRAGGRVVSWMRGGRELVCPLAGNEGGLLRVLFAEEQYPGSSFTAPHRVVEWKQNEGGFHLTLAHTWNIQNQFMRLAGWSDKVNELTVDHLSLLKKLTYSRETSSLVCDLTITNHGHGVKHLIPWVHNAFSAWPAARWVVIDAKKEEYRERDIYWGAHLVEPGKSARTLQADTANNLFATFGAATDHLRGVSIMLPIAGEFEQSPAELRYAGIELRPGESWRANSFIALSRDERRWWSDSPVALYSRIELCTESQQGDSPWLESLEQWMLPAEREAGLMVLSYLDKPPFFSDARFYASHTFSGFEPDNGSARAWVMLYAPHELSGITAELSSPRGWSLGFGQASTGDRLRVDLPACGFVPLYLHAPVSLAGSESVVVTLRLPGRHAVELRVAPDANVADRQAYHVRQSPRYMEERFREKAGPAADASHEEVRAWQRRNRERYRRWMDFMACEPCDLMPRMTERQEGPTCLREKWLIQTEPGVWVPGYLIKPKGLTGRLPLIYFLHGSGPGKDAFAGDEVNAAGIEHMPYPIARRLKCMVYIPDGRGQGEMGETNPAQWPNRCDALGLDNAVLRLRDQVLALDWLTSRPDVDASRIGSMGCSGGGNLTYRFAAVDERVSAAMVISTMCPMPLRPTEPSYFHRMLAGRETEVDPWGVQPLGGAPMGMLVAPRPMWLIDGLDDACVEPAARPEWRRRMQEGRDAIRRVYEKLDAGDRLEDIWFEGGHCAGMTVQNAVRWFGRWFDRG